MNEDLSHYFEPEEKQERPKLLDFNGYDCGDEPSEDEDQPEDCDSSISSCGAEDNVPESPSKVYDEDTKSTSSPPKPTQLVSGDIFLLGGSHILQS